MDHPDYPTRCGNPYYHIFLVVCRSGRDGRARAKSMGGVNLWPKLRLVSIIFDRRDPGQRNLDRGFEDASLKRFLPKTPEPIGGYCQVNRFEDLLSALDTP